MNLLVEGGELVVSVRLEDGRTITFTEEGLRRIWLDREALQARAAGACLCFPRYGLNGAVTGIHRNPFCSMHGDQVRQGPK